MGISIVSAPLPPPSVRPASPVPAARSTQVANPVRGTAQPAPASRPAAAPAPRAVSAGTQPAALGKALASSAWVPGTPWPQPTPPAQAPLLPLGSNVALVAALPPSPAPTSAP